MNLMDGPAPRYIVFDDAPQIKGLGCTADELAAALRVPLAVVGVRVVRQRGVTSKALFSEFQARGMSRKQYDTKAVQVSRIVDEVCLSGTMQKKARHSTSLVGYALLCDEPRHCLPKTPTPSRL
jgi:hypothetical protein